MASISDVAKRAGVSIKTVSRVLNHEPHVRAVLRDKVLAAVKALRYHPSQAARGLAGNRSFLIPLVYSGVLNNPSPEYTWGVQSGAALACRKYGYHLVLETVDAEPIDFDEVVERLVETIRPDGVILLPPLSDWPPLLAAFEAAGTPVVRLAAGGNGYGHRLAIDETEVSSKLVSHLIAAGHRRIGMIKPHPDHLVAQERVEGYRQALLSAGIALDPSLIVEGLFDPKSGQQAARRLLSQPDRPSAIFAANDAMALATMQVARKMGLDLPADLAVAGFDDSLAGRTSHPTLTTVRQPLAQLGALAVERLVKGPISPDALPAHQLIIRASTPLRPSPGLA